ncbi:zinc finger protein ZFP2-like isoform X4 [Engraulis encrasicolus]|uniref:zinc finger protein ZFP2-like isoform X4 n=1 Tax=Engraulis encrasicolus TaxID=184585 RepID=UPI002FD215E6
MEAFKLRVKEVEDNWQQLQDHEVELCQTLRLQVEDLQKRLEEKDNKLIQANKVIRALRDEVQTLQQQLEQHRRKYHGIIGQRDWHCQCGRGNDLTNLVRVEPCVQTGTVPSDCRPSEPEPGSSDAGMDADFTTHDTSPHSPLETIKTEGCRIPPNVFLSCTAEEDPADVPLSPGDDTLTSPQELEEDPADVPLSPGDDTLTSPQELEEDPADVPLSPGDDMLTSPQELEEDPADVPLSPCDGTLSTVKSKQDLQMPVLSVKLQDCRAMLGPDGVYKMNMEEVLSDEEYNDGYKGYQDNDDSDYDPKDADFTESKGEHKRQSRGASSVKAKTTYRYANRHKCSECGKAFSFPSQLSIHQRVHARKKPSTAAPCENMSTDSPPENTSTDSPHGNVSTDSPNTGLLLDEDGANATPEPCNESLTAHAGEKSHACPQCDQTFSLIKHLHSHQRRQHKTSPFECDVCGKVLSAQNSLKVHKRLHTGERPHACKHCDKTFAHLSGLIRHHKAHPQESDVKRKKSTKGREKSENSCFECDLCGKIVSSQACLVNHRRIHTRERFHVCKHCDKTFQQKAHLSEHIKLHTGERPFACTQCGKTFTHHDQP